MVYARYTEKADAMDTKQLIKQAEELGRAMHWQGESDEVKRVVIIPREGPIRQTLLDMIFKVKEDTSLSTDSVYRFTMEALEAIGECDEDATEDDLQERAYEIEPDVYTSDLTEWLNESNYHIYYLDEAIKEGATDGSGALMQAQATAKREVFYIVLNHLIGAIDE